MSEKNNSANGLAGLFYKDSKLQPAGFVAAIALFLVCAWGIRQYVNLDSKGSSANCYGADCQPSVTIGGRVSGAGYNSAMSYGTLYVKYGDLIELTWMGNAVDRCEAVGKWTKFRGTYMPPTLYPGKISASQDFSVKCRRGRTEVMSTLSVVVQ